MTRKRGIFAITLLLIVALTHVSAAQDAETSQDDTPRANSSVRVDVDLVLVNVTVTNNRGQLVQGLEQQDFQIWEDKVEQEIAYFSSEDVPMSVSIIFDVSGSMKDKLPTAMDAYATFLRGGNSDDEYSLIEFSDRPRVAAGFTNDITELQNQLVFREAKGMTALYDAVYAGLHELKSASNPKKALLLITDGEDNKSRYNFNNVKEFVKEQDVQIYAIGIVNDWNSQLSAGRTGRALIEELAELTGGRAFFPDSVYELEDICEQIAQELKHQYVIGYHSTNEARDGKYRKLRVRQNFSKDFNVRAKAGYYAPTGSGAAISRD